MTDRKKAQRHRLILFIELAVIVIAEIFALCAVLSGGRLQW